MAKIGAYQGNHLSRSRRDGGRITAIDDTPDYLRRSTPAARPVQPAAIIGLDSNGAPVQQASTRAQLSAGRTQQYAANAAAGGQQVFDTNMKRRQVQAVQESDNLAQADRNRKAIDANALAVEKGQSRADDAADMWSRPGIAVPPQIAQNMTQVGAQPPRKIVPAVMAQATMDPASGQLPGPLGRAMQTQKRIGGVLGEEAALHEAQPAAPSPVSTVRAMQPGTPDMAAAQQSLYSAMPPADAALGRVRAVAPALNRNVGSAAITGDINDIAGRMEGVVRAQEQYGGDIAAMQRGDQVTSANQRMRPRVLAVPENPVDTFGELRTPETKQAVAAKGSRLETLRNEAARGQAALDTGTSLEQRQREADVSAAREYDIRRTAAANPPRSTGTATQPKPALAPEKAAKIQGLVAELRKADLPKGRAEDIQREIDTVLGDVPRKNFVQIFMDYITKPSETSSATGTTAFPTEAEAVAAKLPKGTRITINGRPAIVE